MNYVKFTVVMAAAIALKQYLEDKKVLQKTSEFIYSTAGVAIMAGGAVPNAVTFIANQLARLLSGDDPKAAFKEKKNMTKLLRLTKLLMPNTRKKE